MGVKTASSHPFSILPRLGFPPSHKTESSSRSPRVDKPEEDWYIPYNGPLEPPKSVSLAKQDIVRHPVNQDDVNTHLEDSQLLYRYRDMSVNDAKPLGLGPPPVQLAGYPRTRIHSDLTRRTASSSSAIDPTRPHPRWHQTSAPRLQILTHTSMDAGVGESPMPAQRIGISNPRKKMSRFFGFGSSKKPKGQSISTPVSPISRTNVPGAWLPSSTQHSTIQDNVNFATPPNSSPDKGNRFDSHYSTLPRPSQRSHTHHHRPRIDTVDLSSSKQFSARHVDFHGKPDQDSLLSSPATNYDSPTIFMAHSSHPYANTSSSVSVSALRPGISQQSHQGHQQLDSSAYNTQFSHNQTRRSRALTYAIDPRSHRAVALDKHARLLASPLKPSVSTPNLSATSHGKQPSQQSTKSTPPVSGVDRWLSPETWCDALFFPRPRLRSERAHGQYGGSSGRIVSPPITPVAEGASPRLSPALRGGRPQVSSATHDVRKEHHVLLKSRSAVDILSGPSISGRPRTASTPQQRPDPDPDPVRNTSPKEEESVPGPSTAQQELRPSASVPSLTQ
ncbi:hypothetical protein DEU56DRAFT_137141 [Suillus clintonianus]|uniref:uncharacterized protein n=1 Tax=Suillus clintonianus TaxID=1904413 RepID=UPI001B85EF06|nr:uncharacterized protein DEU56DRAFT_137141 [Suillus clintonianus]KAG2119193.1 hypothetical protein DEU56DRAFT_137141 [Suillus clintonianus]